MRYKQRGRFTLNKVDNGARRDPTTLITPSVGFPGRSSVPIQLVDIPQHAQQDAAAELLTPEPRPQLPAQPIDAGGVRK